MASKFGYALASCVQLGWSPAYLAKEEWFSTVPRNCGLNKQYYFSENPSCIELTATPPRARGSRPLVIVSRFNYNNRPCFVFRIRHLSTRKRWSHLMSRTSRRIAWTLDDKRTEVLLFLFPDYKIVSPKVFLSTLAAGNEDHH